MWIPFRFLNSTGLKPPSETLIRFCAYLFKYSSRIRSNLVKETACQSRLYNISFFILPKNPSHAELSGEHPFLDVDLIKVN